jgi:hypothetical chaperone protein
VTGFGLDFGTTNSVFSHVGPDGRVASAVFDVDGTLHDVYRSVLFFDEAEDRRGREILVASGPWAIRDYLEAPGAGRLMQSLKTFLATASFGETQVYGRRYDLPTLVGLFLRQMRQRAEAAGPPVAGRVVVGRPVVFAGERPDEALAVARLADALARAGFDDVVFAYEPVAAAFYYGLRIDGPETILVADFGGGTSDFSLVDLRPGAGGLEARIRGTAGVGVAGDAFDRMIVRNVVTPDLGRGRQVLDDPDRPQVPLWIYAHFERWHHLSMLNTPRTLRLIEELRAEASLKGPLDRLLAVVRDNRGFALWRAVSEAKVRLSREESAEFRFDAGGHTIRRTIARAEFEGWIADDVAAIAATVDGLFAREGVAPGAVARVFMTGGTSLVPAVQRLFADRFGADRLVFGDELVSVGRGLALMAGIADRAAPVFAPAPQPGDAPSSSR